MNHFRPSAALACVFSVTACASPPPAVNSIDAASSSPKASSTSLADGGGVDPLEQADPGPFPEVVPAREETLSIYANELRYDRKYGRVRYQRVQHSRKAPEIFTCEFELEAFERVVTSPPEKLKLIRLRVEVGTASNDIHPCRAVKLET